MRSWPAETPDPDIPMSNEDEQKDAEFPDEDELVVDETEDEPASLPAPNTEVADRKGSGGIAWLALFIALVAAAGIGYTIFHDWRAESAATQSASSLAELRGQLASFTESLASLDRSFAELLATGRSRILHADCQRTIAVGG
jgi:uncharacterized protein HemX